MEHDPSAGRPALASGVRFRAALIRARAAVRGISWADALALLLLVVVPVVMLVSVDAYGLTYDEEPHLRLGERVLAFYREGFHATTALSRTAYGAGFDLAAALLRRVSPWDEYRTNHILCIFVAQLGLLGTWKLGRLVAGPAGGLAGLVLLILEPVYYGHQFNNPKDVPFAVGYVWGLYAIARLVLACAGPEAPSPRRRLWLGLGVALGLGMSVRVGGAILIAYLLLLLALVALEGLRLGWPAPLARLRGVTGKAALAALGGWALMLVFWPRALSKPIEGPAAALETVTRYTAYDSPTLLAGKQISSGKVPWNYLPSYFAAQLPELTLLCFVATTIAVGVWSARALRRREPLPLLAWLLLVAVLLPPLYAIARGSTLYNGLRHFLFIIPPLCVLGGLGVCALGALLARRRRLLLVPFVLVLGGLASEPLWALIRLHPHQQVYFNPSSGGLKPAIDNYETEYYGSVYRELTTRFVEQVWSERKDEYLNRTFSVSGCGSKLFFTRNLPLNFQYQSIRYAERSDYYASYVRDFCLRRFRDRRLVTSVERDGATLGVARELAKRKAREGKRAGPAARGPAAQGPASP